MLKLLLPANEFNKLLLDTNHKENPDFKISFNTDGPKVGIEVLDVMHPQRKRGDEEKIAFDRDLYLRNITTKKIDIWELFKSKLSKKLRNDCGKNSWLLIYHNIPYSHISNYGFWINTVCANIREWIDRGIIDLTHSKFEQIFILNSSTTELISLVPNCKVVYSENEQYFMY